MSLKSRINVFLFILLKVLECEAGISFASYYGNHMVLQASPQRAVVWGHGGTVGNNVKVSLDKTSYSTEVYKDSLTGEPVWSVKLDAQKAGGPHVIKVKHRGEVIQINDVMFGDVWLCSGQSNMEQAVRNIEDGADELKNASRYSDVRLFRVGKVPSATEQRDVPKPLLTWSKPNATSLQYFSGVCWLYGRRLQVQLKRPIGLLQSAWGGTRIETWSSPDALASCKATITKGWNEQNKKSHLWNAMIHPLLNFTIKGAIWYQGESNAGWYAQYACQFPAMISDWRSKFHKGSGGETSINFPFGFVQLAPNRNEILSTCCMQQLRWAQTANIGYAPNSVLRNVFMAVAMDLPDFNSPYGMIHPRYKQDIGRRLALSGLTLAYGQNMGRWYGPRPTAFTKSIYGEIEIVFDYGHSKLNFKNGNGYEVCCMPLQFDSSCWKVVRARLKGASTVALDASVCGLGKAPAGVRYAWRESPCERHRCSLYTTPEDNELPAPPFIYFKNF